MLGLGLEGIELHSDADVGEIHEVPMQRVMFPHVVDLAPQQYWSMKLLPNMIRIS